MPTEIRISAKNLGALALKGFCPRCFWIKMKLGNRLPWQIFPGIFSSIDAYSKRITDCHQDKFNSVPGWLKPFGDIVGSVAVPHHSRFFIIDPETSIRLTGVPDEILRLSDGSYFIADNKTGRFTKGQDELLPMYHVQLNGYAYIGDRTDHSPVSGIGLVYYEPQTDLEANDVDDVLLRDGFLMPFRSHLVKLPLEPEAVIPPLLHKVREICDLQDPPQSTPGCKDCGQVARLAELLTRERKQRRE